MVWQRVGHMGSGWGVSKTPTPKPHLTHLHHPQLLQSVLQLLNDEGSEGFAEGLRLLVNEARHPKPRNSAGCIDTECYRRIRLRRFPVFPPAKPCQCRRCPLSSSKGAVS